MCIRLVQLRQQPPVSCELCIFNGEEYRLLQMFNCVLIPRESGGKIHSSLSHGQVSPVQKRTARLQQSTDAALICRCDSRLDLAILVCYVIFTKHPSRLSFFFATLGTYIRICLSLSLSLTPFLLPPCLSKTFPQGQSLASSELATSSVSSLTCLSKKTF